MSDDANGHKPTQWSIDGWSALQSAATLLMMAVTGLVWGIKLESRMDILASEHRGDIEKMMNKIGVIEVATQKGILPVTEARMNGMQSDINALRRDMDECLPRKR